MARRGSGLTLIELLVTLAVLAIGLTMGVPAMHGLIEAQRVRAVMFQLASDMAMARSTAVTRRSQVVLCPGTPEAGCRSDSQWNGGWILFEDDDKDRQPGSAADVLRVVQPLPDGLMVSSSRNYLRYQRDGRSANSNLSLRICTGGQLRGLLVVNNSGRTRSERPMTPSPCEGP